jgi:hypothetical protein
MALKMTELNSKEINKEFCRKFISENIWYLLSFHSEWDGIAQSVQRLAMGWTVRGSNPGGARFFAPVQTGPGAHPASYTMGNGSIFLGLSDRGVELTTHPHLAPRLKKEYSYTSTPPLGLHGLF